METARQLHHLARHKTLRIRDCLPLSSAVDNPSHYVACVTAGPSDASAPDVQQETLALPAIRVKQHRIKTFVTLKLTHVPLYAPTA